MAVRAFAALSWFYRWGCREGGKHPLRCLGAKTVVGMCIGALFVTVLTEVLIGHGASAATTLIVQGATPAEVAELARLLGSAVHGSAVGLQGTI